MYSAPRRRRVPEAPALSALCRLPRGQHAEAAPHLDGNGGASVGFGGDHHVPPLDSDVEPLTLVDEPELNRLELLGQVGG